jgi:hypothetical protein
VAIYNRIPSIVGKCNKGSHEMNIEFEWGRQYIVERTETGRLASHGLHVYVILSAMSGKPVN